MSPPSSGLKPKPCLALLFNSVYSSTVKMEVTSPKWLYTGLEDNHQSENPEPYNLWSALQRQLASKGYRIQPRNILAAWNKPIDCSSETIISSFSLFPLLYIPVFLGVLNKMARRPSTGRSLWQGALAERKF
jgi:hypothetical protein